MDIHQSKVIELLRELHLIAFKEIERLNLRVAELEIHVCQPAQAPANITVEPPAAKPFPAPKQPDTGQVSLLLPHKSPSGSCERVYRTGAWIW